MKIYLSWPFASMQVGETFEVELPKYTKARTAANVCGLRRGYKFMGRKDKNKGYITRIK